MSANCSERGPDPPKPSARLRFSASQIPEKSGLPSGVLGAGADRFGFPSLVRGMPEVGWFIHCAATGIATNARTGTSIQRENPTSVRPTSHVIHQVVRRVIMATHH